MSREDARATFEAEILLILSNHGGERIQAGPAMERLVDEISTFVLGERGRSLVQIATL